VSPKRRCTFAMFTTAAARSRASAPPRSSASAACA
jgi:hypothetical protein